jgi:outer membrane immunogenic protein
MKRVGLAIAAIVCSAPVWAADLSTPAPAPYYKAPPVMAPVSTWEGFYAGGHVGYGWDPANASFNPGTFATSVLGPLGGPFVLTGASPPVALSVAPKGWLGGLQLGYNWQRGMFVYGGEADISWSSLKGSTSAPFSVTGTEGGDLANFTGNVGLQETIDYFGTLRGRLGWTPTESLLLYGTGGLAWAHVKTGFNVFGISAPAGTFTPTQLAALQSAAASSSDIRWGYAAGGGLEWMVVRDWSVKAEYLYVGLSGTDQLVIPGGTANSTSSFQIGRVGFNYHFRP